MVVSIVDVTAAVQLRVKSAVSNKHCVHSRSKFGSIVADKERRKERIDR